MIYYKNVFLSLLLMCSLQNLNAMDELLDFDGIEDLLSLAQDRFEWFDEVDLSVSDSDQESMHGQQVGNVEQFGSIHDWQQACEARLASKSRYYYKCKDAATRKRAGEIISERQERLAQIHENKSVLQKQRYSQGRDALCALQMGYAVSDEEKRLAENYERVIINSCMARANKKNAFVCKQNGEVLTECQKVLAQFYERDKNTDNRYVQIRRDAFNRRATGEILSEEENLLAESYQKMKDYWALSFQSKKNAYKSLQAGESVSDEQLRLAQLYENRKATVCRSYCKRKGIAYEHIVPQVVTPELFNSVVQEHSAVQTPQETNNFTAQEKKRARDRVYQKKRREEKKQAILQELLNDFVEEDMLSDQQRNLLARRPADLEKQRIRQAKYMARKKAVNPSVKKRVCTKKNKS